MKCLKLLAVLLFFVGTAKAFDFVEGPAPGRPGDRGSCFITCPPRSDSQFTQCVNWWQGDEVGYGDIVGYFQCASTCRYSDNDPYPEGVFGGRWAISTCAPNAGCNTQQLIASNPRMFGRDSGCWAP